MASLEDGDYTILCTYIFVLKYGYQNVFLLSDGNSNFAVTVSHDFKFPNFSIRGRILRKTALRPYRQYAHQKLGITYNITIL